jgi:hypothetical protein
MERQTIAANFWVDQVKFAKMDLPQSMQPSQEMGKEPNFQRVG